MPFNTQVCVLTQDEAKGGGLRRVPSAADPSPQEHAFGQHLQEE